MTAGFYFHMPVKMLDALDYPFAFLHTRTCSLSYRITVSASAQYRMRLMGIAPWSTPVYKSLELSRYIRPIGWGNAYYYISIFKFCDDT